MSGFLALVWVHQQQQKSRTCSQRFKACPMCMAEHRRDSEVSPAVAAGCWARFAAAALAAALSGLVASTGPQLRVLPQAMHPVMRQSTPWPKSEQDHRNNATTILLGTILLGRSIFRRPHLPCWSLPASSFLLLGGSELSRERRLVDTGLRFWPSLGPGLLSADFAPAIIHTPAQPQDAMACLKQGRPAFSSQAKKAHAWHKSRLGSSTLLQQQ